MSLVEIIKNNIPYFGEIKTLKKKLTDLEEASYASRPLLGIYDLLGEDEKIKILPIKPAELVNLSKESQILVTIYNALTGEIFRNGIEVKGNFIRKCTNEECNKEFNKEIKDKICDECGSTLREPNLEEKKILEKIKDKSNLNNQNLIDVLKQINLDLEVLDDCYLLTIFEYIYNGDNLLRREEREIIRIDPVNVRLIADNEGIYGIDENRDHIYMCPRHRTEKIKESQIKDNKCPRCKGDLFPAFYVVGINNQGLNSTKVKYYAEHEIVKSSKYNPSLLYGYSNIISSYQKLKTLLAMDKHIMDSYLKQRSPKGILVFSSPNYESIKSAWKDMVTKTNDNPHQIYPMALESNPKGKSGVEWLNLMSTPAEMELTVMRNEYRRNICATYGVTPLFAGESALSGNEGLQVVVANRTVQRGQEIIKSLLKRLVQNLQIKDYSYDIIPNERRDEMAEAQLEAQKIANAMNMKTLGFGIKLNEEGDFEYIDADPETEAIDPEPDETEDNLTTKKPENGEAGLESNQLRQRFEKEPLHTQQRQGQRFEGEPITVRREFNESNNDKIILLNENILNLKGKIDFLSKSVKQSTYNIEKNQLKKLNEEMHSIGLKHQQQQYLNKKTELLDVLSKKVKKDD